MEKFFENVRDLEIKQLSHPLINNYETSISGGEPNSRKDDHPKRDDMKKGVKCLLKNLTNEFLMKKTF